MENLELPGGGCYLEQVVTAHSREPKVPRGWEEFQVQVMSVHLPKAHLNMVFYVGKRKAHPGLPE